jgi:hypothetical protein
MAFRSEELTLFLSWYWRLLVILGACGFLLILSYVSLGQIDLIWLVKIPQLALFFLLVIFHFRFSLKKNWLTVLFLIGGSVATLVGLFRGVIYSPGLPTHFFMTIMPILAMSFGAHIASIPEPQASKINARGCRSLFLISFATIGCYSLFFYGTRQIPYFGFDSYIPVAASWFLANSRYSLLTLSFALVVLSGKRAPLVAMATTFLAQWLVFSKASMARKVKTNFVAVLFTVVFIFTVIYFGNKFDFFYRFEPITTINFSDNESLFLATSGRSNEIIGLLDGRVGAPLLWITGGGFGGGFTAIESSYNEDFGVNSSYYLHFAILTYVMVFGAPFAILFVSLVFLVLWRSRKTQSKFYVIGAFMMFVWSFFGAGLIVEPIFWVFLGAAVAERTRGRLLEQPPFRPDRSVVDRS